MLDFIVAVVISFLCIRNIKKHILAFLTSLFSFSIYIFLYLLATGKVFNFYALGIVLPFFFIAYCIALIFSKFSLQRFIKAIPNIFTLLNLIFGCLAIVCILQTGLTITTDDSGQSLVIIPEKIYLASVFIGCAAIIDFLDGFVARLFRATSEMGKQLDSLADVVSFGVAPGLIVYEFLRMSYAQQTDGLDINAIWLLPAFLIPAAGAYRLARFNIDTEQNNVFKGVPIPAAGLLIASFPLIYWYSYNNWIIDLLINKWFWYAVIFIISYLMISSLPMLALKFKKSDSKKIFSFIILAVIAVACTFIFQWLAVPVTFIAYVILSLFFKQQKQS